MSTHKIGPLRFSIETRELDEILTGARVALRRRGEPIDPDRIPDGWELRHKNHPKGPWPTGWTCPTGYWLLIWKRGSVDGAHMAIKPYDGAWRVEYDLENSWMGGDALGNEFTFNEAVTAAIDGMERINDGATQRDLRFDYRDWGETDA